MNSNQYKFKEGETHQFKIVGFTEIPGTEESFFILENNFGGKHLLESINYTQYNLEIGKNVNCRIDKINCSGKIYLEPDNPFYNVGEVYDFEFLEIIDQINSVGEKENAVLVKDIFGIKIACSIPSNLIYDNDKSTVKCKVTRIKKGKLFLTIPDLDESTNNLQIGNKYCFTVVEIKSIEDKTDYYILKDEFGKYYSLQKSMYEHYEFKTDQKVECIVTKYNTDGNLKVEPVHPHYIIGKSYSFNFIEIIKEKDALGNEEKVIIVKDIYGIETKVRSSKDSIPNPIPEKIYCKVDGIRKGKAILSLG